MIDAFDAPIKGMDNVKMCYVTLARLSLSFSLINKITREHFSYHNWLLEIDKQFKNKIEKQTNEPTGDPIT